MGDSYELMLFQSKKKSTGAAYLLWLFLGGLGAHWFYLGYVGTGFVYVLLVLAALLTFGLTLIVTGLFLVVDLFLIPGMAERKNSAIMAKIRSGQVA